MDIRDYGFLSDCRSAALVATNGSIDWLCWPQFDSASIFAKLLDERGGYFQIAPVKNYSVQRKYIDGSNILETIFTTSSGVIKLTDWLHIGSRQALCRKVECLQGEVAVKAVLEVRPGYAKRGRPQILKSRYGYLTSKISRKQSIFIEGFSLAWEERDLEIAEEEFTLSEGQITAFTIGLDRTGPSNIEAALQRASKYWQDWSRDLRLPERVAPDAVLRSALTLKGLHYRPSGAIISAATTSLPQEIGGQKNYDYRYSWIRDSVFAIYALRGVASHTEAESYFDWLKELAIDDPLYQFENAYTISGEQVPHENMLRLAGYKNSRPVVCGNNKVNKHLSTLGELADVIAMHHRRTSDPPPSARRWLLVRQLALKAAESWRQPDYGFWDSKQQDHFVYSKVMCWVAMQRAVKLASKAPNDLVDAAELADWEEQMVALRDEVLEQGYNQQLNSFTQKYNDTTLDTTSLLFARLGFIDAKDQRFISTVRALQLKLTDNGMLHAHSDGNSGIYIVSSLWMVLALLEIESVGEAEILFSRMLAATNDLGLYSEQLSSDGEQLGNFPQAFGHIALIICAFSLDRRQETMSHVLSRRLEDKKYQGI